MPRNRKLNPGIHQPTYLLNSAMAESIERWLDKQLPRGGDARVLDVGCGEMPYRELFERRCADYIGCDLYSELDDVVKCPADDLAFEDASFDTIVCFQVLEHVTEPWRVIEECARVTRPGGTLILTVPFMFPYHASPYDYYRYTTSGLRHLAERAGYTVKAIEPQCDTLPTLLMLWNVQVARFTGALTARRLLRHVGLAIQFVLFSAANLMGSALSRTRVERFIERGFPGPANYILVAERNMITELQQDASSPPV